ncbi:S-layer homology domain-containing protein [Cohnella ginsengisoli]|uniref:S-layer homology domain-containing protein n=1 Tax=Cohnella ginsengisoli TaxID=425004 RepID=A0A9X4KL43_9BACL|nr:S-layer homology domain-containing protein [Cohnella ginsengisoli]MDG0794053.1 S-layer homology domain-containing protein [Cohnella ginsengisoli]
MYWSTTLPIRGAATQFVYSSGGTVSASSSPPADADWAVVSNFYDSAWSRNSSAKLFTYSYNGSILQASDPMSIPPDAAWATISSFKIEGTGGNYPIKDTLFKYSVNGTDILTASDPNSIPANAQWATLASFNDAWKQTSSETYSFYTLNRISPQAVSLTVASDNGDPSMAKPGSLVSVSLQTDLAIKQPAIVIGGSGATVSGSGTSWTGTLTLDGTIAEGPLTVSAVFYGTDGAPAPAVAATTDGSSVTVDKTAPAISYTLTPNAPTKSDVVVDVTATDALSGVAVKKWASGTQDASYFGSQGTALTNSFAATANGTYTIYVSDGLGNERVSVLTVGNIDREPPTATATPSTTAPTNGAVVYTVTAADNVGIDKKLMDAGTRAAAYFQGGGGTAFSSTISIPDNGTYTYYVSDTAGNELLETLTVSNIFKSAPTVTLAPSTTAPTNDAVTVDVTAAVDGEASGNSLAALRWATGARDAAYFAGGSGGTDLLADRAFEAVANGTYTVYARDAAGNVVVQTIVVGNIDSIPPTLALTADTTDPTNGDVTIDVDASDADSGIDRVRWAAGEPQADIPLSWADVIDGSFVVEANGTYTVYVRDKAGNETISTIAVANIFTAAPVVTLAPDTTAPTNDSVYVAVEAAVDGEASGNSLAALRWAAGARDAAYFAGGSGGTDLLSDREFEVEANGTYTVYARDAAGNVAVQTVVVGNIDTVKPTLALTADTTGPTNGNVTVTVDASDADSGIDRVRWAAGEPQADIPLPWADVIDGSFVVEANGTYAVSARDKAGNRATQLIAVHNIFKTVPVVTLAPDTTAPTGGKVNVAVVAAVDGEASGNSLAALRWAAGARDAAYFAGGSGGTDLLADRAFEAEANGTYAVYARDAAGNVAVQTIEVNNIRRTDASLASLRLRSGETELALTPAFDPEKLQYSLEVDSTVDAITVKPTASDEVASVTVNGTAQAGGAALAPIALTTGVNTVRIVVAAQLSSVQRTYTIAITKKSAAAPTPTPTPTPTPASEPSPEASSGVNLMLGGKRIDVNVPMTAVRNADGTTYYELDLNETVATLVAQSAAQSGDTELRVLANRQMVPNIDDMRIVLDNAGLAKLEAQSVRVTLAIDAVAYQVPAGAAAAGGKRATVIRLRSFGSPSVADEVKSAASSSAGGKWELQVAGVPVDVDSSYTGAPAWLVLPLPTSLIGADPRTLAAFVEYDDGTKAIEPGTVQFDSQGRATGIAIKIGSFARLAVIQADPISSAYDRYVSGYADGTFQPARLVTRAEVAVLLAKQLEGSQEAIAAGYRDVPGSHWAASAIGKLAAAGIMKGGADGQFRPNELITRAELAVTLTRWKQLQPDGAPRFADAVSHWAAGSIAAAERAGWITGYADGTYRPDRGVTRAEAVVILNRVFGRPALPNDGSSWSDVPAAYWASGQIVSASLSFEAHRYLNGEVELADR